MVLSNNSEVKLEYTLHEKTKDSPCPNKKVADGLSIQDIELTHKDMPQFDRERARTMALTEVLAASSAAQHESYVQSPAVKKKKWRLLHRHLSRDPFLR
ncbi:hypothetical protein A4A36_07830 [Bacillus subtilis]|nr:hypothetical protein A4A37_14570 [Bacillus subtilis]OIS72737.1 hypothetical protein A4A36_07830 [Bacillus subtilis]OIS73377.1 hypothetical protein A4A35_20500 [Bacillus subtilis]